MDSIDIFGVYLSLIGIYWLMYSFFLNRNKIEKIEQENIENKYKEELKSLQENDIDLSKNYMDIFVEESVESYGLIKMCYNVDDDKFIYYTDFIKSIPYKILDIIARKYVIINDCKNIYVDINEEVVKKKNSPVELVKKEEIPQEDVFVRLKSYNVIKKKNKSIKDKINNFKYGGKITDMMCKEMNKGREITFSDYKKNV